uniref:Uncharacterized protein n=1 Tax=Arundo donax TaxID=35708 RepID=A0A0A8Y7M7_ARUDO
MALMLLLTFFVVGGVLVSVAFTVCTLAINAHKGATPFT